MTEYVGKHRETGEWMLFTSWADTLNYSEYTYLMPARPSDSFLAKQCGRVLPELKKLKARSGLVLQRVDD